MQNDNQFSEIRDDEQDTCGAPERGELMLFWTLISGGTLAYTLICIGLGAWLGGLCA